MSTILKVVTTWEKNPFTCLFVQVKTIKLTFKVYRARFFPQITSMQGSHDQLCALLETDQWLILQDFHSPPALEMLRRHWSGAPEQVALIGPRRCHSGMWLELSLSARNDVLVGAARLAGKYREIWRRPVQRLPRETDGGSGKQPPWWRCFSCLKYDCSAFFFFLVSQRVSFHKLIV